MISVYREYFGRFLRDLVLIVRYILVCNYDLFLLLNLFWDLVVSFILCLLCKIVEVIMRILENFKV